MNNDAQPIGAVHQFIELIRKPKQNKNGLIRTIRYDTTCPHGLLRTAMSPSKWSLLLLLLIVNTDDVVGFK
jgi:hypothetical protein